MRKKQAQNQIRNEFFFPLLFLASTFFVSYSNGLFTKFQWKDLGSNDVEFLHLDLSPMPLVNPGASRFDFRADFKRAIAGPIRNKLKIIRTVSGLALPISW